MVNDAAWQKLIDDFNRIDESDDFKLFQDLLDQVRPLIAHPATPNDVNSRSAVEAMLREIEGFQGEHKAGNDVESLISEKARIFSQDGWNVRDVKQAGKNFTDNSTNIFVGKTFEEFINRGGGRKLSKPSIAVPIILVAMT